MRTFHKYTGAGNDFLIFEDFDESFPKEEVSSLCDRHFGIGSDGLILIRHHPNADCEMLYFNCDGKQALLCGNGLRCVARFLQNRSPGRVIRKIFSRGATFQVDVGESLISTFFPIPTLLFSKEPIEGRLIYGVNSGVVHFICFENEEVDVSHIGKMLRWNTQFVPEGGNVNFVWDKEDGVFVRTYEKGVERETLACGTGVVAVAFIGHRLGKWKQEVEVIVQSKITFLVEIGEEIRLQGPAHKVFEGEVSI